MTTDIHVTTLAPIQDGRLLLVRKRGSSTFILAGGKPLPQESDQQTLEREILEELGCGILAGSLAFLGVFSDAAADAAAGVQVHVRLYAGLLQGVPQPSSEIEELLWLEPCGRRRTDLAPSLVNVILPSCSARMEPGQPSQASWKGLYCIQPLGPALPVARE
jgi:8-oxo-dGTP diphosphatase